MQCYYHPEVEAAATCPECGKAICKSCAIDVGGKIVCQSCLATANSQTPEAAGPPNNKMALASMACGLGGWVVWLLVICLSLVVGVLTLGLGNLCLLPIGFIPLIAWIASVITGHMGIKQLKERDGAEGGRGMAITGLISGYIGLGLTLLGCVASVIIVLVGGSIPIISELLYELGM